MAVTSLPTSTNANINATTKDFWIRSAKDQIFMRMPVLARMVLDKRVVWKGGKSITRPVVKAEMDELSQSYIANQQMTAHKKTMLDTPYFLWKYNQTPLSYDVKEWTENIVGGSSDTQVINFLKFLVEKGQRAARIKLYRMFYGMGTTAAGLYNSLDTQTEGAGANFQSCRQALTHDLQYGHLTRTDTTVNDWWQGGSLGTISGTSRNADWDTAIDASIHSFRLAMQAVTNYTDGAKPGEYLCVMGPVNFLKLKEQVEARHIYNVSGSTLAKYGFNAFMLDGVEVVEDPWLTAGKITGGASFFFLFHMPDWELRILPQRNFKLGDFVYQGNIANGYDQWLARIFLTGNFICWQPNASMHLSAMS